MRALTATLACAVAALLASCATTTAARKDAPPAGKVHIYYEFTAADRESAALTLNVYRASRPEGPFQRINERPLSIRASADEARALVYTDRTVPLGSTAWYYLTAVGQTGAERKLVPVTAATAVIPNAK